jgi:hypothetical protein
VDKDRQAVNRFKNKVGERARTVIEGGKNLVEQLINTSAL